MNNATHRFLPPEWHPQSGVMLTWPHKHSDWASKLALIEPVFVDITKTIARFEKVLIVAFDQAHRQHIAGLLDKAAVPQSQIRLHCVPSNDTWARDHGPITVIENGKPIILDFTFNGWGNKFDAGLDTEITPQLVAQDTFARQVAHEIIPLVMEGGSIESDGHGTILTTTHCLMSDQRNPAYSKSEIEKTVLTLFGAKRMLWLDHGHLDGDDTDSHIDTIARYADAHTIIYVACDDETDSHFQDLQAMEAELRALKDYKGKPYRLIPLPWPAARYDEEEGRRLPATYANFLIINGAVLVPTYDDPADALALQRVREAFPHHEVIGIPSLPIIMQNGSLHCLTMQLPEGVLI